MISVNPLFADFCIITAFYLSLSMNSLFLCCAGAFCLSVQKTAIVIVSNVYYIICLVFFFILWRCYRSFYLIYSCRIAILSIEQSEIIPTTYRVQFSINESVFSFRLRLIAYFSAITRKLSSHLIFFIQCPFYSYF